MSVGMFKPRTKKSKAAAQVEPENAPSPEVEAVAPPEAETPELAPSGPKGFFDGPATNEAASFDQLISDDAPAAPAWAGRYELPDNDKPEIVEIVTLEESASAAEDPIDLLIADQGTRVDLAAVVVELDPLTAYDDAYDDDDDDDDDDQDQDQDQDHDDEPADIVAPPWATSALTAVVDVPAPADAPIAVPDAEQSAPAPVIEAVSSGDESGGGLVSEPVAEDADGTPITHLRAIIEMEAYLTAVPDPQQQSVDGYLAHLETVGFR